MSATVITHFPGKALVTIRVLWGVCEVPHGVGHIYPIAKYLILGGRHGRHCCLSSGRQIKVSHSRVGSLRIPKGGSLSDLWIWWFL
jgi:hypothetical protein